MTTTILATAAVLGVLVFVHELGHFLTAKWADIEVPKFSIGFGPKVLGFRRGETEYVISLLPLGGYVKMAGMEKLETVEGKDASAHGQQDGAPSGDAQHSVESASGSAVAQSDAQAQPAASHSREFHAKPLSVRALVTSSGVLMNLLFAIGIYAAIALIWGVPATPPPVIGGVHETLLSRGATVLATIEPGTRVLRVGDDSIPDFAVLQGLLSTATPGPIDITLDDGRVLTVQIPENDSLKANLALALEPPIDMPAHISEVWEGGRAEAGGMEEGDVVVAADGKPIKTWQELIAHIGSHPDQPVQLKVERGRETLGLTVVPAVNTLEDGFTFGRIGIATEPLPMRAFREPAGPITAASFALSETGRWIGLTLDFLRGLIQGEHSPRDLGGPLAIAQFSGEAARAGIGRLLQLTAFLSINLAILNLLPIPVLDGGHLVFLGFEAARGRALPLRQRIRLTRVGAIIIIAMMAFAIGNDVLNWIGV